VPVFRKEVYLEIQEERGGVGHNVSGGGKTFRGEVDEALSKLGEA